MHNFRVQRTRVKHRLALPAPSPRAADARRYASESRQGAQRLEEIIIIVIQFIVEVVGQALVQVPFDCATRSPKKPEEDSFWRYVLFLIGGGLVGWCSVGLFPKTMLHQSWLRIANLVLSPIVAIAIAGPIASYRSKRNLFIEPKVHAWSAFWFTLGLAAIRFAYAKH